MEILRPTSLGEALGLRAGCPPALAVAGGTDVLVELNARRCRPEALLDLGRVPELRGWERAGGSLRIGAAVTHTELCTLTAALPGLAAAAGTVGSRQIRNRGTLGGNLGTASPAGDTFPPLLASGAEVEVASVRGARRLPLAEFLVGPKRHALGPDELIAAVHVPATTGPQGFAKVGPRNAMAIAVVSFALSLDPEGGTVGAAIGSAGPTALQVPEAASFLAGVLEDRALWQSRAPLRDEERRRFAELVVEVSRPIDDRRGTAAYRRHALGVLAARVLGWAWDEYRRSR